MVVVAAAGIAGVAAAVEATAGDVDTAGGGNVVAEIVLGVGGAEGDTVVVVAFAVAAARIAAAAASAEVVEGSSYAAAAVEGGTRMEGELVLGSSEDGIAAAAAPVFAAVAAVGIRLHSWAGLAAAAGGEEFG